MARVHPQASISSPYMSTQRETFTVWMKSLVYQTNGLTVYNSNGEIIYRVENYERKCSSKVHVMDLHGNILFTVRKKKLWVFGCWNVHRWGSFSSREEEKPSFQIRRFSKISNRDTDWEVREGNELLWILRLDPKVAFQILDIHGNIVAEVKPKQNSGVTLGDDVLSLEVKPCVDHSLVVAIVTIYGLMKGKL